MQVLIYSFCGDLVTSGPYSQTATVARTKQPVWGLESPTLYDLQHCLPDPEAMSMAIYHSILSVVFLSVEN